jgi:phage/plasmid-associated DNA primase
LSPIQRFFASDSRPCLPADNAFVERMGNELLCELFSFYVKGAMDWYANGCKLPKPAAVKEATAALLSNNDSAQQFIDECCDIGGDFFETPVKVMYSTYIDWFDDKQPDATMLKFKAFGDMLEKSKGFRRAEKKIDGVQLVRFRGIRVKAD